MNETIAELIAKRDMAEAEARKAQVELDRYAESFQEYKITPLAGQDSYELLTFLRGDGRGSDLVVPKTLTDKLMRTDVIQRLIRENGELSARIDRVRVAVERATKEPQGACICSPYKTIRTDAIAAALRG